MPFSNKLNKIWQILSLIIVFLVIISNIEYDNTVSQMFIIQMTFVAL